MLGRECLAISLEGTRVITINNIEFKQYSQHGEDGVISFLTSAIREPDHYFIEIGCSDGRENNSSALLERGYSGVAIDGDAQKMASYTQFAMSKGWLGRVLPLSCMINFNNVVDIFSHFAVMTPDFFSLDIDGIDYYVMTHLLIAGFKPKVVCVEYNATMTEQPIVVNYDESFNRWHKHQSGMYYGCSVASWKYLFEQFGYRFVTVESSGTNAFFVDENAVNLDKVAQLKGEAYLESAYYNETRKTGAQGQFNAIKDLPFVSCDELLVACVNMRSQEPAAVVNG